MEIYIKMHEGCKSDALPKILNWTQCVCVRKLVVSCSEQKYHIYSLVSPSLEVPHFLNF